MADLIMLSWTSKAKKAYELLASGMKPSEVRKAANISPSYITKIKKAMANGESPDKAQAASSPVVPPSHAAPVNTTPPPSPASVNTSPPSEETKEEKTAIVVPPGTEATVGRLMPMPVLIPMTPVMFSMKSYLVEAKGWNPEVKWEDIIDTIFALYAKSIGIVLRGWYEEQPVVPPKPAGGKDNGNGNGQKEAEPDNLLFKQLANKVTLQIIQLAKEGKLIQ